MNSLQTTLAGIACLIFAALIYIAAVRHGTLDLQTWGLIGLAVSTAVGLWRSRDNKITDEAAGAKPPIIMIPPKEGPKQ